MRLQDLLFNAKRSLANEKSSKRGVPEEGIDQEDLKGHGTD